jgi:hypothetical protein
MLIIAVRDNRDGFTLLILAIALVVIGFEVADESAFHDGARGVLGGESVVREGESKGADALGLEGAHGGTG